MESGIWYLTLTSKHIRRRDWMIPSLAFIACFSFHEWFTWTLARSLITWLQSTNRSTLETTTWFTATRISWWKVVVQIFTSVARFTSHIRFASALELEKKIFNVVYQRRLHKMWFSPIHPQAHETTARQHNLLNTWLFYAWFVSLQKVVKLCVKCYYGKT